MWFDSLYIGSKEMGFYLHIYTVFLGHIWSKELKLSVWIRCLQSVKTAIATC